MTEQIKELIDKIQQEGIAAAQNKAREIEEKAKKDVEEIIQKAKSEAEKLINAARDKNLGIEESTKVSLKQAARDLLIALRKEINAMLNKIILQDIQQALGPQDLAEIITELIKNYKGKEQDKIEVLLKKQDLARLEKDFLAKLKKSIAKEIVLRPCEDILAGFIISYDSGKSHFDFTDKALAEYIGKFINPKLNEILLDS